MSAPRKFDEETRSRAGRSATGGEQDGGRTESDAKPRPGAELGPVAGGDQDGRDDHQHTTDVAEGFADERARTRSLVRSRSRCPGQPGLRSPDPGGLLSRDEPVVDPAGDPMFEVGFPVGTWSRGLGGGGHRPRLRYRRAPDQCGWPRHARPARRGLRPCVPARSALPPTRAPA